jgi:lipid A 4'-phosphatase
MRLIILLLAVAGMLAALMLWPQFDLRVSDKFFLPGYGFIARQWLVSVLLNETAFWLPRLLAMGFILAALLAFWRKTPAFNLPAKAWLFLLLGLLLGPGLIANVIFKDHWGRARPSQIEQFGGAAEFTPALIPAGQCERNCSFVSGDGAFGFYLPIFAYVIGNPRRSRRLFWLGLGAGTAFGFNRVLMGAHFLSDVVFAAVFMLLLCAGLFALLFGRGALHAAWANWLPWLFPTKQKY